MDFTDLSNFEIFNLENFVLHYNSILCFCNPRNIYHNNTESHESTKILTLKIFRLYGTCQNPQKSLNAAQYTQELVWLNEFSHLACDSQHIQYLCHYKGAM